MDRADVAWDLFCELRKELIESQKLRAQVIGFKITFVSAAIGLIGTNLEKIPNILLVIPAFAAIFFDFLINSYRYAIKRIGFYNRNYYEPSISSNLKLPDTFIWWENFLHNTKTGQSLAFMGNMGITLLAVRAAIVALVIPFCPFLSSTFFI